MVIKSILRCFELVYGLRVNYHKSMTGAIGIPKLEVDILSRILNCSYMKIPFKYLGMPIGGNPRQKQFWDEVVDKVRNKLSRWKRRILSFAGRVCLINSVISAIILLIPFQSTKKFL